MRTFTASTLAFLLVLAPTVPAMADSGGDIVFERMQAQAAKARAAHQENWRSRPKRRRQGKLLIASSSTPAPHGMTEGSDPVFTRHRFPGFRSAGFMPVGGAGRS